MARADPDVQRVNGLTTAHLGPEQIVVALSLEFRDERTTSEIEACVERLERSMKAERSDIVSIFVKPQTSATWRERRARLQR